MCGIAGILKLDARAAVQAERLQLMADSLHHRGPDAQGMWCEGRIGLAHRRLSIIDLATGQQPMHSADAQLCITYNGELYNFRELRAELEQRGCRFVSQSDTEVVLQAYAVFGEDCVDKLRGMFAFAIWDHRRQSLFLARDRLGIKPLYLLHDNNELIFASEIKGILAARDNRPVFNRNVLAEFLGCRYVSGPQTFFEGIEKLLPGHAISWSAGTGMRLRRYWQLPVADSDDRRQYRDYIDEVRTGLEDAVRSHLVSDVPVGLFLSGGIDSSALAGLMAPMMDEQLQTFSVGFSELEANELGYARLAANSVGAKHRDVTLTAEQFFSELPKLVWHEDEPIAFTSSIPLHVISRLAKQHVKVVLTGEGADELFLGYDYRYRVTIWNLRLGSLYRRSLPAALRRQLSAAVSSLPAGLRRYAERSFLAMECNPRELFFENFSVFRQRQRLQLLRDPTLETGRDIHGYGLQQYREGGGDDLDCMSYADINTYLVELLMKQDQMSMAASLESRVPFLDHQLVEQIARIPGRHRLHGGRTKSLLRDAVRDVVPPPIMNRSKMGFPVPIGGWLRGPFWWLVEEFVLGHRASQRGYFNQQSLEQIAHQHRLGRANHAEQLWLLISLEIWQRIFIDGEAPEDIYHLGGELLPFSEPCLAS